MNKIKEIFEVNKEKIKLYSLIIILGFICIGPFFRFHMASDSYFWVNPVGESYENLITNPIITSVSGRPISDMFLYYVNIIGLNMMVNQQLFNFLSVVIMLISTILLYKTCEELTKNKSKSIWITGLASFLIIFNAFSFELFIFNVMTCLALQYIIIIISIRLLLKEINLKNVIIAIILNSIGLCIYQGISPIFIGLAMILLGYKYKDEKIIKNIKNYFIVGIIYGISCISNALLLKISGISRYEDGGILEGIKTIIRIQPRIWIETFGFLPKYMFGIIIAILLIISFVYIIKKDKKKFWNMSMCLVGASVMTVVAALIPYVFSAVGIMPRSTLTISTIPWIILLFLGINYTNLNSYIKLLISSIIGIYIFILINLSYRLTDAILLINKHDEYISSKIMEVIEEYEETNNIKITKFAFANDENYTWSIPKQPTVSLDSSARALTISWSCKNVFYYYHNREFETVPMDEEIYNKYFKGKDWDEFNKEQVVCIGDTVYMVNY